MLIAAAQKVEHYEIDGYETLGAWAELRGCGESLTLLQEILAEEKGTDEKLTAIGESNANPESVNEASTQPHRPGAHTPVTRHRVAGVFAFLTKGFF